MDTLQQVLFWALGVLIPLLLCLLPSPPEPQDGVELTSPLDPSPLSGTNMIVKCLSNQPESCFRDKSARICSRLFILLVLLPLPIYLEWFLFKVVRITERAKPYHSETTPKGTVYTCMTLALFYAFLPPVDKSLCTVLAKTGKKCSTSVYTSIFCISS